ncbi:MAG TPA: outer membrane protein assembly factor BamB [Methylophilaceae bacterium]|jgi:outer membrane protein assembly factor BamB|nr:outer membrane protein assembly factor BamB [Methylophilaceae bacterium]
MSLRYLTILAFALLAGCSSLTDLKTDISERMFGPEVKEPPMPLADFKQKATAKLLWSASVGEAEGYIYTPAIDAGSVFAANTKGEIIRVDAVTGKQVWRVNAGESISGGVGAGENLVLVGTPKGMVLAYDQNGKALWKAKVSSEVLSAPKVASGVVVVRSGDSRIYGLSTADGKRKWVYERATPSLALRSSAGVTLADGAAYVGFAGGKMVALKADDGKLLWEASVALPKGVTEIERIADITSLPVVDGRYVYAVAFQGRVAAVDRTNGRVLWNRDISSYTGLGADDGKVFVTHSGGAVYALDNSSGKSYWRQGGLLNRLVSAPLSMGEYVAVGDLEGYVHFLAKEDGAFAARIQTDKTSVMAQPVSLGESTLMVQTSGGGLYAVSLK